MAVGEDFARRARQALSSSVVESAARSRNTKPRQGARAGVGRASRPRVERRDGLHLVEPRHARRFVAFMLIVLERIGTESGKAAHNKLWLGESSRHGAYRSVAEQHVRSLAYRLQCSPRELQRYIAIAEAAGLWRCWQPKEAGARAPERFTKELRGETYAYNHYQLIGDVPRVLRENLLRWYGGKKKSATSSTAPSSRAPSFAEQVLSELPTQDELTALLRAHGVPFGDKPPPS